MSNIQINLNLDGLLSGLADIDAQVAQNIHTAIGLTAQQTQEAWVDAVMKAPGIWQVTRQRYARSISWRYTGPFSAEVFTPLKEAEEIERGRPARDLKRMLDTSLKVRRSKQDKRYLIIPFRHNAPSDTGHSSHAGQMPAGVYKQAQRLSASRITGTGRRSSGTHAQGIGSRRMLSVPSRQYHWGNSLPAGTVPKLRSHHKADPYAGMRRFETGASGTQSSTYLTFRVMSEDSTGWIVPAKPGLFIVRDVVSGIESQMRSAAGGGDEV